MNIIVAGRFETQDQANDALAALNAAGFSQQDSTTFFVNPRGQHAQFPIGGDQDEDASATQADSGAVTGAVAGGAAGVAAAAAASLAIPAVGPAIALGIVAVGAYTGSLAGTLSKLGKPDPKAHLDEDPPSHGRKGGMLVAVHAMTAEAETLAVEVLERHGAKDIERTRGEWKDGDWKDFDPVEEPQKIDPDRPAYDPRRRIA